MSSHILKILKVIDTLGRPFRSGDIDAVLGDGTVDGRDNISSMICWLYRRGILEHARKEGRAWIYTAPEGMTATQAHKLWKAKKDYATLAVVEASPKKEQYPMPPFPLGGWRSKRVPDNPERFVRGGM